MMVHTYDRKKATLNYLSKNSSTVDAFRKNMDYCINQIFFFSGYIICVLLKNKSDKIFFVLLLNIAGYWFEMKIFIYNK